jgi:hypothetical protein
MSTQSKNDRPVTHPLVWTKAQEASPRRDMPDAARNGASRLNRKRAAEFLGVSLSWLDKSRVTGIGPPYILLGSRVVYDSRDLEAYMNSNRHSSTSEY